MQTNYLHTWAKELKLLVGTFIVVLSIGFYSGLSFVGETSSFSSIGIQENYLGNEDDEEAEEMKFKKTERHMLSVVHSHILSMSMIFFLVAVLVFYVDFNSVLKKFLMIEPLVSVVTTFGGIYFLWKGLLWMKYIVMISGLLMTLSYSFSIILIFWGLTKKRN
ncbi:MAG: hypothetical protein ACPG45_02355 [Flavobacteriaceae bacterium]